MGSVANLSVKWDFMKNQIAASELSGMAKIQVLSRIGKKNVSVKWDWVPPSIPSYMNCITFSMTRELCKTK